MKFKTSALAMTATVAVGLMSSAFADENPYENLGFKTNQTYSADASGTSNGSWNKTPVVTDDSKIEIDSDSTDRFTFTPATVNSGENGENTVVNATELKFNVEASVVPNSVGLATSDDAQCGFAIKETSGVTNIWVFNGIEWKEASDATIPAAGAMFDLEVKLDYRSNPGKVQYLVEGNALTVGSSTWLALPEDKTSVSGIDFIGNGKLTSLNGYVLQIVSEVIPINPGSAGQYEVTFSETQMEALKTAVGGDASKVSEKLSSSTAQVNGLTPFDNYVLLGKIKDSDVAATDKPVVKADPSATPSAVNNVVVKVPLFKNVQTVGGVDVTHVLKGSANGADGWTQVGVAQKGNEPQFEIPANSPYRYFKVETTVSPTGK